MGLQQGGPDQPPDPVTAIRSECRIEIIRKRLIRKIADRSHTEEPYLTISRVGRDAAGFHFNRNRSASPKLFFFFCGRGNSGARTNRTVAKACGSGYRP